MIVSKMAHQDQAQRCNINGIGRPKEKRMPQRGLGVAQLEKIRLEEQQKRLENQSSSSSSSSSISFLSPSENFDGDFGAHKLWNKSSDRLNLPQEFNPIWTQKSQHPSHSHVVNVPMKPTFQKELPSNQSYHGNSSLISPEEHIKMLGNKRRFVFADIDKPSLYFDSTFLAFGDQTRGDGLTSNLRELGSPSCSNPIPIPNPNSRENRGLNGRDFLTLSLPTSTTSCLDREILEFDTTPFEVNGQKFEDGQSGLSRYEPFHSFFPPAKRQNHESAEATRHCFTSGADDEYVDLNLKL